GEGEGEGPVVTGGGWLEVGDRLELTASFPGGVGALTYQWNKDGSPIVGQMGPTYEVASVDVGDSGVYSCTIEDESAKAIFESTAVRVTILAVGTLPVAGIAGVALLAGALGLGAALLGRKK
ncbi:MAG: hypothetical protein GWP08_14085, partial [Nitrospiraceae bacterium]|nr:hypothetical protein [Nitrospiraceae bacterium]